VYSPVTITMAPVDPSPPKLLVVPLGRKRLTCAPRRKARSRDVTMALRRSSRVSPAPTPLVRKVVDVSPPKMPAE
jgi:hypothetical protein